jgi:hypothetical protein
LLNNQNCFKLFLLYQGNKHLYTIFCGRKNVCSRVLFDTMPGTFISGNILSEKGVEGFIAPFGNILFPVLAAMAALVL